MIDKMLFSYEFVLALLEVLASMCTTGLLAVLGTSNGNQSVDEQILQLQSFNQIRVPDTRPT